MTDGTIPGAHRAPHRAVSREGPADALDHATSEIAIGCKLGIDATRKLPGEGVKRRWPPLIRTDEAVKAKVEQRWNEL